MKTGTIHIFYHPTNIEFLNTTLDSLLRQDDKNLIIHAFFERSNHNIVSLLKNYQDSKLHLHALNRDDDINWREAAISKQLASENDLYSFISDGCVFSSTWASALRKTFNSPTCYIYAITNSALLDQDGSVIRSYSFESFAEWLMAVFSMDSVPMPVVIAKISAYHSNIHIGSELPQDFFGADKTAFVKSCHYGQRATHKNNTAFKKRDIARFIRSVPRKELADIISDNRRKKLVPLFAAVIKGLPAAPYIKVRHSLKQTISSTAGKNALKEALKKSIDKLVEDYFIIDPDK